MTASAHSLGFQRAARVALTSVLITPSAVWACPSCKEALSGDAVGTALSATTLLLIAIPMVLVASIGGWVGLVYWRAARRAPITRDTVAEPDAVAKHPI